MEKNKDLRVFAEEIRVETIKELAHLGFGHIGRLHVGGGDAGCALRRSDEL